uniref:Similar to ATMUS81 n=1 Tax=Arundo donax TaxID=35708 RepID=A0A0A9EJZ3_ARUDO
MIVKTSGLDQEKLLITFFHSFVYLWRLSIYLWEMVFGLLVIGNLAQSMFLISLLKGKMFRI